MKSVRDQIAGRCIHFNGIINKECKAGIKYTDVRVDDGDGPYKWPCLKQAGECSCAKFRTDEEVDAYIKDIEESGNKADRAYDKIKEHHKATKKTTGTIKCECGGDLNYSVSSYNGHIWGNCNSCKLSFKE